VAALAKPATPPATRARANHRVVVRIRNEEESMVK
jgi:hypothetical protein